LPIFSFFFSKPVLGRACSPTYKEGATIVFNPFSLIFVTYEYILRFRQQNSLFDLNSGTHYYNHQHLEICLKFAFVVE